jgi:hypothetical protein
MDAIESSGWNTSVDPGGNATAPAPASTHARQARDTDEALEATQRLLVADLAILNWFPTIRTNTQGTRAGPCFPSSRRVCANRDHAQSSSLCNDAGYIKAKTETARMKLCSIAIADVAEKVRLPG